MRERSAGRRITVALAGTRAHEKLLTTGDTMGKRGLPVRDRSRGGDGRADVPREGARDRGRFAEMQRTGGGGLPRDAEEQGDERQHARRRHAKNTHREGALQPISSRSRSEVAAHD